MSNKEKPEGFNIKSKKDSGLSSFIKRPVPSDSEVEDFEEVLGKETRNKEIDANLDEIYRNKQGDLVDVQKMRKKYRNLPIVRVFKFLMVLILLLLVLYFVYLAFFTGNSNVDAVDFEITGPETVVAGEEFSYIVTYTNKTKYALTDISLDLNYSDNFIFISSSPEPKTFNNSFNLGSLTAGSEAQVEIKGKIIAEKNVVNVVSATMHYMPANFSSQFKKESSTATVVDAIGFEIDLNYPSLVFIGQKADIDLNVSSLENSQMDNFVIEFQHANNSSIEPNLAEGDDELKSEGESSWLLEFKEDEVEKNLSFKYLVEASQDAGLVFRLKARLEDGQSYTFYESQLDLEAVKSDINIALLLNGEKNSQPVSFSDTLEYTIEYSNKGESAYEDANITAVLDGELYDFDSLQMNIPGELRSNQIIWNKQDIADLAKLEPGDSGEISFSIKVKPYDPSYSKDDLNLSAYSQYGGQEAVAGQENSSNVIESPLNSNLSILEEIRYFDENNIPVGSGPLPPQVGEESTFRVYWDIVNDIHELKDVSVSLKLPDYVSFVSSAGTSVGNINLNQDNEVVWDLGRLPISVYEAYASFTISITPNESDLNKILVLSSGATVIGTDIETKAEINDKSGPKTTKLEDDDIAALNNSGRVQ